MKNLAPSFIFAFLVLASCSKKDDPAAPSTNSASASYVLDGRPTVGTGYTTYYAASANTAGKDALVVVINSTATGAASEDVVLYYYKPAGADNSQYKFDRFLLDGPAAGDYTVQASSIINQSAGATWSGTFSGSQGGVSIKHVLKDGSFKYLK